MPMTNSARGHRQVVFKSDRHVVPPRAQPPRWIVSSRAGVGRGSASCPGVPFP